MSVGDVLSQCIGFRIGFLTSDYVTSLTRIFEMDLLELET